MSDNPIRHVKSICPCCKQEVEFLSMFAKDELCASCQYANTPRYREYYGNRTDFGWSLHPECCIILEKQTEEKQAGVRSSIELRKIRQLKRSRAMRRG